MEKPPFKPGDVVCYTYYDKELAGTVKFCDYGRNFKNCQDIPNEFVVIYEENYVDDVDRYNYDRASRLRKLTKLEKALK